MTTGATGELIELKSVDRLSLVRRLTDAAFCCFGLAAAVLLAFVLSTEAFSHGWADAWFVLVVYVLIAYLVLPRIHAALSSAYLPDYFIGRTRTREGILGDPSMLPASAASSRCIGRC